MRKGDESIELKRGTNGANEERETAFWWRIKELVRAGRGGAE